MTLKRCVTVDIEHVEKEMKEIKDFRVLLFLEKRMGDDQVHLD